MSDCLMEDLEYISNTDFIPWEDLKGKTLLVTGATGLIGYSLITSLLYVNERHSLNLKIIALVRDVNRAIKRFADWEHFFDSCLFWKCGTIESLPEFETPIDYIVHGASQTDSKAFIEHPVETILTNIKGTENILELSRQKNISSMVYLSSMEVYGYPPKGHKVKENEIGQFSPFELRNSYPLSKIQCEGLCYSYMKEYGVPVKVIRLTQTFGPGVNYNDNRIFAYIGRCVAEKKDIVLKTKGETERSYLYTRDAVTAILSVLLKGENGVAYNAADENTYCSIAEMAKSAAQSAGINVIYEIEPSRQTGFPDTLYMDLDTSRLINLGWKCVGGGVYSAFNDLQNELS